MANAAMQRAHGSYRALPADGVTDVTHGEVAVRADVACPVGRGVERLPPNAGPCLYTTTRPVTRWLVAAMSPVAVAGCAGPQSSLAPAGPAAQTILTLSLVLFIGATVIWLLVMVLLACSLHHRRRLREAPARRLVVLGGLAVPTIVLLALLAYGVIAGARITALDQAVDQVVTVRAYQWGWEFGYLDADDNLRRTSIDRLHLPVGKLVEFQITSSDVIHSFWIPRLGGKIDALPGKINRLRLKADRDTPMTGQCAEFCGRDHALMRFAVEVMSAEAFDRWLIAGAAGDAGPDAP